METNWIIERLDSYPEHQGEQDVVCTVYWRANAQDGDFYATCYGTVGVTLNPEEPFTPYASLTQDQVLQWVWEGGIDKDATEAALAQQIETQKNPPVVSKPLPWNPPQEG
jgi:hypothetical protein